MIITYIATGAVLVIVGVFTGAILGFGFGRGEAYREIANRPDEMDDWHLKQQD